MKRKTLTKILTILATTLFVPSILLFSFSTLILNEPFTNSLLESFSERPGQAKIAITELFSYYAGERAFPPLIFNPEEQAHLQDTKRVIDAVLKTAARLSILFLAVFCFSDAGFVLRRGCLALIIVSVVLLVFFNQFFDLFHALFFPPGSWQFPSGSLLVQFYPFSFFAAYVFWIAAQAVLLAAGLALASLAWRRK